MQRLKDETYLVCCATYGGPYLTMMRTIIPKEKAFELADKLDTNLRRSKTIAICTSKKEVRRAQNRTLLFFLQEWCN